MKRILTLAVAILLATMSVNVHAHKNKNKNDCDYNLKKAYFSFWTTKIDNQNHKFIIKY